MKKAEQERQQKEAAKKAEKEPEQMEQLVQIEKRIKKNREGYMDIKIPDEGFRRMNDAIERAKREKQQYKTKRRKWTYGFRMAAVFAVVFLVPNCSKASAEVLMDLPVVGRFFEVITIRNYQFDDGHSRANVQIPKLHNGHSDGAKGDSAVDDINSSVEQYTNEILDRFKENQKIIGDKGHQSLDISYKVLTNTDDWFTLEVTVDEVQASGYEYKHYYHIDKSTGKIASLKDVFLPGSHYLEIVSAYIKEQMEQYNKENGDGDVYWIGTSEFGSGYEGIDDEQSFYFDPQGHLVIIFDEYEVAPGYMGMPKFVIPQYLITNIRRF